MKTIIISPEEAMTNFKQYCLETHGDISHGLFNWYDQLDVTIQKSLTPRMLDKFLKNYKVFSSQGSVTTESLSFGVGIPPSLKEEHIQQLLSSFIAYDQKNNATSDIVNKIKNSRDTNTSDTPKNTV